MQVAEKYPRGDDLRLKAGELLQWFGEEHGFCVLIDEVHTLADGRRLSHFLAAKVR